MKSKPQIKKAIRARRHGRVRAKIQGDSQAPRISVFKSLKHIYAQIIDDNTAATLVAARDSEISAADFKKAVVRQLADGERALAGQVKKAYLVGQLLAAKAQEKKITQAVFDRGGYKYHGLVKALADGARAGGLKF